MFVSMLSVNVSHTHAGGQKRASNVLELDLKMVVISYVFIGH